MNLKQNKKGLTLIELMVALAILAIIVPIIVSVSVSGFNVLTLSSDRAYIQQDARLKSNFVVNELRNVKAVDTSPSFAGSYYALTLKSNGTQHYLAKQWLTDGAVDREQIIGAGDTIDISFFPTDSAGLIDGTVESARNGETYTLHYSILLENIHDVVSLPSQGTSILYYSKYE
ncbi:MAG: PilW family protein [Christensenellales bacterium]